MLTALSCHTNLHKHQDATENKLKTSSQKKALESGILSTEVVHLVEGEICN